MRWYFMCELVRADHNEVPTWNGVGGGAYRGLHVNPYGYNA